MPEPFIDKLRLKTLKLEKLTPVIPTEVTPKDRLIFAKQILFGISVISMAIILLYWINPTEEFRKIIEIIEHVVPPIITLVIGFYFSSKDA